MLGGAPPEMGCWARWLKEWGDLFRGFGADKFPRTEKLAGSRLGFRKLAPCRIWRAACGVPQTFQFPTIRALQDQNPTKRPVPGGAGTASRRKATPTCQDCLARGKSDERQRAALPSRTK